MVWEFEFFQVGKVTVYDGASKMTTLIAVPEYPLHVRQSEGVEENEQQDEDLLPPYNPDGSLEVRLKYPLHNFCKELLFLVWAMFT